jgi:hypothetical protein
LIEIIRFDNPQHAVDALIKFNRIGSHTSTSLQLYNIISSYIQKNITLHDLLIGILSICGYRDDYRMQDLIRICVVFGATKGRTFNVVFRDELTKWKVITHVNEHLMKLYAKLYDVICIYNNFKGKEFKVDPEELKLGNVIMSIYSVIRLEENGVVHG